MVTIRVSGQESFRRKKRVSKKNKKSWRKHTDTKDVDVFLDDQRLEERLGKPFAERKDDELFQLDIQADKEEVEPKERRKKALKPIRCFSILKNDSAVPDPIAKRNRVRTPEERKHSLVKKIEADRKEKGIVKLKEVVAAKSRHLSKLKKQNRLKKAQFKNDIWEKDSSNKLDTDTTWLSHNTFYHVLKNTRQLKKKLPDGFLKKPFSAPTVPAPHPGTSYNPTFADHQELLQKITKEELEFQKQERHLNRVTSRMFRLVSEKKREKMWMNEMSQGLPKPDEKQIIEEDQTDMDYSTVSVNPPVENKKKTLKERRKLKEAKKAALDKVQQKIEKKKVSDIYKLKFLNQEIETKAAKEIRMKEKREKAKAARAEGTKKLSKVKFEPLDLEFNLAEELSGNLRNITPQGNILQDRFKSLQQRNIIEPTLKRVAKKAKVKVYEKKSHKMGWEPKGY